MNRRQTTLALLFILAVLAHAQTCSKDCNECDSSGNLCFACGADKEVNVLGSCHDNTIDKCIIYGPSDECFRCQPTFSLKDGKCQKSYSPCINEGANG